LVHFSARLSSSLGRSVPLDKEDGSDTWARRRGGTSPDGPPRRHVVEGAPWLRPPTGACVARWGRSPPGSSTRPPSKVSSYRTPRVTGGWWPTTTTPCRSGVTATPPPPAGA